MIHSRSDGFARSVLAAFVMLAGLIFGAPDPAHAGIIYFTDVTSRLNLNAQQRSQVRKITKQSESATLTVFRKYGIDPRATPDPSKLRPARRELEAIERNERSQLSRILDRDQMEKYDRIMSQLRARVARAAMSNRK